MNEEISNKDKLIQSLNGDVDLLNKDLLQIEEDLQKFLNNNQAGQVSVDTGEIDKLNSKIKEMEEKHQVDLNEQQ